MKIEVELGPELFHFTTFANWCDTAAGKFHHAGVNGDRVLCLDTKGRICTKGKEFMRARDDDSFPVRVYAKLLD